MVKLTAAGPAMAGWTLGRHVLGERVPLRKASRPGGALWLMVTTRSVGGELVGENQSMMTNVEVAVTMVPGAAISGRVCQN